MTDLQQRYERIVKDAGSFCARSLTKLDKHDFGEWVGEFIEAHNLGEDEGELKLFSNDLTRRLQNAARTHSKESLSKLINFLENCPDSYENYHRGLPTPGKIAE